MCSLAFFARLEKSTCTFLWEFHNSPSVIFIKGARTADSA